MKEKTILAQNIQTLRKEKGWTQEELAERLRCSFDAIQAYECCKREPACKVMVALEQVFGVTREQLYGKFHWLDRRQAYAPKGHFRAIPH